MSYNTTPFHGKLARAEKNDVAVDFTTGWDVSFSMASADISRQGQDATELLPGQYTVTGTISCQMVAGNTEQKALWDAALAGTKLTDMKLLLDGSTNAIDLTNGIYILSVNPSTGVGGAAMWDFGFQATGTISLTDSA
jgi:hypothetical protein